MQLRQESRSPLANPKTALAFAGTIVMGALIFTSSNPVESRQRSDAEVEQQFNEARQAARRKEVLEQRRRAAEQQAMAAWMEESEEDEAFNPSGEDPSGFDPTPTDMADGGGFADDGGRPYLADQRRSREARNGAEAESFGGWAVPPPATD